jgi:hypothetical protein
MKIISAGVLSAILVAGVAGSFAAYRSQTAQDVSVERPAAVSAPAAPVAQAVHPGTKFRWAPCPKGSTLVRRACVTDVVRTVVVPAAPVYVAAASTSSSSGGGGRSTGSAAHESAEHESEPGDTRAEDHADDGGEDHADGGDDGGGHEGGEDHGDD